MTEIVVAAGTAFWLGILTSISPCPLATNIAAISFVSRRVDRPSKTLLAGVLYTFGRVAAYALLGSVLVLGLLAAPKLSMALQKYMNKLLGPLLIVVGLVLLEMIRVSFKGRGVSQATQSRVEALGLWGALALGFVFALSFCPVSAALFFGSLLPIALEHESGVLLPAVYGIATGLPVLGFAVLIAFGAHAVSRGYEKVAAAERWMRRVTGVVFIAVGIYYCLVYVFGVGAG